eukprot:Nk52_evm85s745 gene=Nk52_evmTU85s745
MGSSLLLSGCGSASVAVLRMGGGERGARKMIGQLFRTFSVHAGSPARHPAHLMPMLKGACGGIGGGWSALTGGGSGLAGSLYCKAGASVFMGSGGAGGRGLGWALFHSSGSERKEDYYETLGVSRGASQSDIKRAYYKLAKKYHPDTNKDEAAQKKFQAVSEAYEVLGDKERRANYDQFGFAAENGGAGGFGGGHPFGGGAGGNPFAGGGQGSAEDLFRHFEEMFGSQGRSRARQGGSYPIPGDDMELDISLSFMEAVHGVTKPIKFNVRETCKSCSGTGAKKGSRPSTCPTCGGSGQEDMNFGMFRSSSPCRTCGGVGTVNRNPCSPCRGQGTTAEVKSHTLNIPAGVDNGIQIQLPGLGNAGMNGGPRGGVYVNVRVMPSSVFRREGQDVHSTVDISLAQAILGGSTNVQSLDGLVDLRIPSGTQPSDTLRLSQRGIKGIKSNTYGHHFVHFNIVIPKNIKDRQRELMEEWSIFEEDILAKSKGKVNIRPQRPSEEKSSPPTPNSSSDKHLGQGQADAPEEDNESCRSTGFFSEQFSKLKSALLGKDKKTSGNPAK